MSEEKKSVLDGGARDTGDMEIDIDGLFEEALASVDQVAAKEKDKEEETEEAKEAKEAKEAESEEVEIDIPILDGDEEEDASEEVVEEAEETVSLEKFDAAQSKINKLEQEITRLQKSLDREESARRQEENERKSIYDQYLRLNADFDNFRKRTAREKDELRRYGAEGTLKALLEGFDNFDRALQTMKDADAAIRDGIEMVYRQFLNILTKHGVERFESKGQPFDYTQHEAISIIETNDVPPDTVFEEYQAGYRLHDRLLRPAMVVVSKAGPKPKEEPAPEAEAAEAPEQEASAETAPAETAEASPESGEES